MDTRKEMPRKQDSTNLTESALIWKVSHCHCFLAGLRCALLGNLLVADCSSHRVRLINLKTNQVSTLIGTGENESGEEGPAATTPLSFPTHLTCDAAGNVFVDDTMFER